MIEEDKGQRGDKHKMKKTQNPQKSQTPLLTLKTPPFPRESTCQKKRIRKPRPIPYIPLEKDIDQLIGGFKLRHATFLQMLKECGFRPIEALRLTWDDIDFTQKTIIMNKPAKGSLPRKLEISDKLLSMLKTMLRKENPKKSTEKIWKAKQIHMKNNFIKTRMRLAKRLGNRNLRKISWYALRHFYCTRLYNKTKDPIFVQRKMGHKYLQSTTFYIDLITFESDEWISKVADTEQKCCQLIETGFEYVCDFEGKKIFKKRK